MKFGYDRCSSFRGDLLKLWTDGQRSLCKMDLDFWDCSGKEESVKDSEITKDCFTHLGYFWRETKNLSYSHIKKYGHYSLTVE